MSDSRVAASAKNFMLSCLASALRDTATGQELPLSTVSYKFSREARTYTSVCELYFRVTGVDNWRLDLELLADEAKSVGLFPAETWCSPVGISMGLADMETRTQFHWQLVLSSAAYEQVPGKAKKPRSESLEEPRMCLNNYFQHWNTLRLAEMPELLPNISPTHVNLLVDELLADYTLSEVANRATGLRLLAAQTGLHCNIHSLDFEKADKPKLLAYLVARLIGSTRGLPLPNEVPPWAQKFLGSCTSA